MNVPKRIVITAYMDLFDDEIQVMKDLVQERLKDLDFPEHVRRSIRVEVQEDPFYKEEGV